MGNERILVDTNILIEYFRNKKKEETILLRSLTNYDIAISILTKYEFSIGINPEQYDQSLKILEKFEILDLTNSEISKAIEIFKNLKKKNLMIPTLDILIASTAISNQMKLATLNLQHFQRIEGIKILEV
jgi:tRNA(fMet)-specific endonuclease VapC